MSNLRLHIFGFLCFVYFLLLDIVIVNSFFSIVPIILILFCSLLPSPSCELIINVDVLHVDYLVARFTKFWPWKDLCRLFFNFLCLFYYCITTKNDWTRAVWFARLLRTMRIFRFVIIPRPISWGISLPELWIKVLRHWFSIILSCFRELSTHLIDSFKNLYYKLWGLNYTMSKYDV